MTQSGPVAEGEQEELIKEVHGDDDLDMTSLGKPISALKPVKQPEEKGEDAAPADDQPAKPEKKKKKKMSKEKSAQAAEAMWSQLDKEIADVSEDDLDNLTPNLMTEPSTPQIQPEAPQPTTPKRGVIVGGLSGGASLGANAPIKEGPKDHSYEIVDGEAKARVYDTPELRGAFLYFCKSSIKVSEMHLVHEGPFMAAQQFVQMCKDYKLLEPDGKLSFVMVGIIYTTSKSDDDEGLAFGQFLDSLVSLAFECETNVAGVLQADWDKKDVLNKANKQEVVRPPRGRPQLRNLSTPGTADELSGAQTPGTGATTPGSDAGGPPGLNRTGTISRFHEIVDAEGGQAPMMKKKEAKTRFQGVESMTQSTMLDKVNEVSKIKTMATSRATSVINSRVTSRMVSRLPSRRASEYGSEDDDDDRQSAESPPQGPAIVPPVVAAAGVSGSSGYNISPSFLSTHVHAALEGYEGYQDPNDPDGLTSPHGANRTSLTTGPNGEPISPLFAVAGNIPGSPLSTPPGVSRVRSSFSGNGAPILRPSTAQRMKSVSNSTSNEALNNIKTLPKDLINKGFGDAGEEEDKKGGKPPLAAGLQAACGRPSSNGSDGSGNLPQRPSLKSALSKGRGPKEVEAAFGSPVGSLRARFSSDNGVVLASSGAAAAAAATAVNTPAQELPLLSPGLSKQVNIQLWSEWAALGGQGEPSMEWVTNNLTKYMDGTAGAASTLNNVSRSLQLQDGSVAITAQRGAKGTAKAAPGAAPAPVPAPAPADNNGRRDSLSGDVAAEKQMSPYELQLARLEAKYKKNAPGPLTTTEDDATVERSKSGRIKNNKDGAASPVWRPAGKEGSLSGRLNVDVARATSGLHGHGNSTGEGPAANGGGPRINTGTGPHSGPQDAANVLKSTLLAAPGPDSNGNENLDSPTDHRLQTLLPNGEALSPQGAVPTPAPLAGRVPLAFNHDQMAMMASFGQGVLVPANGSAPTQPQEGEERSSAGFVGTEDEKFAFVQKRRAEMEAKLAAIEQKFGGANKAPGSGETKPKPPSGPPPGSSPRTSNVIAAVRKAAAPPA